MLASIVRIYPIVLVLFLGHYSINSYCFDDDEDASIATTTEPTAVLTIETTTERDVFRRWRPYSLGESLTSSEGGSVLNIGRNGRSKSHLSFSSRDSNDDPASDGSGDHALRFAELEGAEKDNCPICQESISLDELTLTECNHKFHEECLKNLMKNEVAYAKRCPVCRAGLKELFLDEDEGYEFEPNSFVRRRLQHRHPSETPIFQPGGPPRNVHFFPIYEAGDTSTPVDNPPTSHDTGSRAGGGQRVPLSSMPVSLWPTRPRSIRTRGEDSNRARGGNTSRMREDRPN